MSAPEIQWILSELDKIPDEPAKVVEPAIEPIGGAGHWCINCGLPANRFHGMIVYCRKLEVETGPDIE
jgi:hypothetical protein